MPEPAGESTHNGAVAFRKIEMVKTWAPPDRNTREISAETVGIRWYQAPAKLLRSLLEPRGFLDEQVRRGDAIFAAQGTGRRPTRFGPNRGLNRPLDPPIA